MLAKFAGREGPTFYLPERSPMRMPLFLVLTLVSMGCHNMRSAEPTSAADPKSAAESASAATVSTFLMFQGGDAEEAMSLYASVFPGARVERIERYGRGEPGPEGTVKVARFDLNGHRLMF